MKNIIKRKLPYLLFFLLSLPAFLSASGQEPTVTINFSKASFQKVLKEIEKQTSLSAVYNTADVDLNRIVTIKVEKERLSQVMIRLLKGTNLSFSISNTHIILSVKNTDKEKQQPKEPVKAKGTIVDNTGEPLIGVNVQIKGTSTGTITDIDGNFALNASKGDVLDISYIGYAPQAITIVNAEPLKIVMGEDTKVLDEVVITALGIKREQKALSYNVQQVKGDELTTVKDANFMNALSGKVAGVNINTSSAGVGGATRVVMRGTKSISANNNALYVIDGIPIFNTNRSTGRTEWVLHVKADNLPDSEVESGTN